MGLRATLGKFTKVKQIELQTFFTDLKATLDNCSVYEGKRVQILAHSLGDDATIVYETYTVID